MYMYECVLIIIYRVIVWVPYDIKQLKQVLLCYINKTELKLSRSTAS